MRSIALLFVLTFLALTLLDCGSLSNTCSGQCSPDPGYDGGFYRSVLLWSGAVGTAPPACPQATPTPMPGLLDTPPTSVECNPPCNCTATAGTCSLPSSVSGQAANCGDPTAPLTPSNPPPMWDGSCTAANPASQVSNVTIQAPGLTPQGMCLPAGSQATTIEGGTIAALMCLGSDRSPGGSCSDDEVCAFPGAPGFLVCLLGDLGLDLTCPLSWPNKHTFFGDASECNCSCGSPEGESCATTVTVYSDSACSKSLGSANVATDEIVCIPFAPGSTVGSKSATPPVYQPGTCAPILVNSIGATLCCLP
jgi:hypothetical protein